MEIDSKREQVQNLERSASLFLRLKNHSMQAAKSVPSNKNTEIYRSLSSETRNKIAAPEQQQQQ